MLTETQQRTLRAAVDRIVPADDGLPGALDAGAFDYLLGQFERDLTAVVPLYKEGLDALDIAAQAAHNGTPFADLGAAERDALLTVLDDAHSPFFRLLCEHSQESYYISPLAWEVVGWKVTG
jgi:hypothetical protein